MKRVLSVFLALILVVSCIFSVTSIPASAGPDSTDCTNNFEDETKWTIYDYSVSHVNSTAKLAGSWAKVLENTDSSYVYEGATSLKFTCQWQVPAYVFAVEKNTEYTFSFKYLDPASPAESPVASAGVINNNYNIFWNNSENEAFYAFINTNTAYTSNGNFSERESNWELNVNTNYTAGKWNEIVLKFNSGDNETLTFSSIFTSDIVYVDDLKLLKEEEEPDPTPDPTPSEASKWQVYVKGNYTALDGTATNREGWNSISDNTDPAFNCGDLSSVKYYGSHTTFTRPLSLESGKKYKISFKYYMPDSTIPGESGDSLFYQIGIVPKGAALGTNGRPAASAITLGGQALGQKNVWNEYSMEYENKDATEKHLYFFTVFTAGYTVYFADVKTEDITPEPEPTPDPTPSEASKWQVYVKGNYTALDGTATNREGWNSISDNTDPAFNCGDISSVKYYGSHTTFTRPLSLESGKKYKISFKYYMPDSTIPGESGDSLFYQIGIVPKGAALGTNGRPAASAISLGGQALGQKNVWNEYSMEFENKDATEKYLYLFTVFTAGYTVYFADVKAEEITSEPEPTPDPTPSEASKWQVYLNSTHPTVDGTATNREGWNSVADNTDAAFNYGELNSVKVYGSHSTMARPLEGIEKGKSYKISFKFYMPASTVPYKENSMFYQSGIVAKGTAISSGGGSYPMVSLKYGDPYVGEFDKWNEYSIIYTNWDDTEEFFYFCPVFNSGYTLYIADFKVEETYVENPGLPPFNGWGTEPKENYLISFDDFDIPFTESYVEVVKGPERDSVASNTLHIIGGEYNYAVFPRYDTVTKYNDPYFTLPVKENTLYEYSFWIYIDEDAGLITWLQFFYDHATPGAYILLNKTEDKGKWMQYTARFITKSGQDKISLGFNASEKPYDMWIDDFRVREIAPGVTSTMGSAGYCEDMLNMLQDDNLVAKIEKGNTTTLKIPVAISSQYTFGIDIASKKDSNSRLFLSYDGINPIQPSEENAPVAELKAGSKNGRYSFSFVTNTSGYIYIVIENDDSALSFAEPMLFYSYTLSSGRLVESETPIDRELSVNEGKEKLKKISTTIADAENNSDNEFSESPKTGDSALPLMILIITFIAATVLLAVTKKGGEQA